MKKIVYIFDGALHHCNSVRDILYNILCQFDKYNYEQIVVRHHGILRRPLKTERIMGYKTYSTVSCSIKQLLANSNLSIYQKVSYLIEDAFFIIAIKFSYTRHIYSAWAYNRFYNKIFKLEKPDIVVYFAYSPQKGFSKICKKSGIPHISVLYDTIVGRPNISQLEIAIETEEIPNTVGYFVPDFFVNDYTKYYNYSNIYSYKLPLLIPKNDVIKAYTDIETTYKFTYFGQMQTFRNGNIIKEIFKALGEGLDVFTSENHESDDIYVFHNPVSHEQLYKIVASSDFLVAFDNAEPYAHYLPSKAYLYVSFTKPIIVFGNNEDSALKQFLDSYPLCYYHNYDDKDLNGLIEFINTHKNTSGFDEELYSKYTEHLPQEALVDMVSVIKNAIDY